MGEVNKKKNIRPSLKRIHHRFCFKTAITLTQSRVFWAEPAVRNAIYEQASCNFLKPQGNWAVFWGQLEWET